MSEANKCTLIELDDALRQCGMLERIRLIVNTGIEKGWSVTDVMSVINREISVIKAEVTYKNEKAQDELVRRELGVDDLAIILKSDYERALFLAYCIGPGRP
ncbi:hypothetical protein RAL96_15575 [Klebsiella variicola]|jgi:hypothetical protein|uniref:hypothetical protein n=1 Tax=Klebsiella TaxID=570 RepID=UPI0007CBB398|nr:MULTISPECIES: hypothetical protein [Klebsiella]EJI7599972.1 hypothetical protein [Klebsiella pneumoniae]EJM8619851.1 hypothetical protein [Klebsiella pneumoniae]EKV7407291.1 hypothetical protein [Klebsiella pneumoniae]EKW9769731.1 hypothetical protein [Klebsiella pneumoniae]EKX4685650.1 hypothetical protein [Klebsiella pneumoniae]